MHQPMAGFGSMVVAGAVLWPLLRTDFQPAAVGATLLAMLGLSWWALGRSAWTGWLAVLGGGLLLGLASAALRASPPAVGPPGDADPTHVTGTVLRRQGLDLLVDSTAGPLRLRTDAPLARGQGFAAWTAPVGDPVVLPGAASPRTDDLRGGWRSRRVRQILPLGGAPAAGRPDPFVDARHRGLLRALALGDRSDVDSATRALLRRTGTSHLLAISGLHVGLLAGAVGGAAWVLSRPLVFGRFWPVARWVPAFAAAGSAVAYALAVGAPASARRAAVMVAAAAGAVVLGRRPRAWSLLGFAATALVVHDGSVVGDLGFQLSFSAVAGILLVTPRVTRFLPPDHPWALGWLVRSLGTTLGATAGTLPIAAWRFQELAPVAPAANLLAAPLVGIAVVPAAIAATLLPAPLAGLAIHVGDGVLDVVLATLGALDRPAWTPAVGPVGVLLLALALLLRRRALAAALLASLALGLRSAPTDRLTVTFLAVGQGDATLVEWPDGRRWLVDGGPGGSELLRYLRRRGIRRLDALVLSHAHPDHSRGLVAVANALPFDSLWLSHPPEEPSGDDWRLWQLAWKKGARLQLPDSPVPDGVRVEHPLSGWRDRGRDRVNEESLVLRLQLGDHTVLLGGDIEDEAERTLARTLPPTTLVKVSHHGSRTSSTPAFVAAVRPQVAVIPVGRDNRFGHPHAQTLARWRASPDTRLLRTDRDGTIEWSTDGQRWALRTWRVDRGWTRIVTGRGGT